MLCVLEEAKKNDSSLISLDCNLIEGHKKHRYCYDIIINH